MKKLVFIIFTFLLFSCNDDSTNASNESIIGTWQKIGTDGEEIFFFIEFNELNEYFVYFEGVVPDEPLVGNYTLDGNEIKMNDNNCEGEGVYKLDFSGNQVEFILIYEKCGRKDLMTGTFKSSNVPKPFK